MRCSSLHLCCFATAFALTLRAQPAPHDSVATNSGPFTAVIPARVDLRPVLERFGLRPRLQGARPTCSVFTVAAALEFATAKRLGQTPRLSVEFLNWASNKVCGDFQDGGFFSDMWKGFAAYGICAETNMSYEAKFEPTHEPSAAAIADAKTRLSLGLQLHWLKPWDVKTGLTPAALVAIKQTLANGWPVCSGLRWPKQELWVEDVLQPCPATDVRDGHSVLLVGYRDDSTQPGGGVFLFRNTSHGGKDGAMPYAYAQEFMNDAVWVDCQ
jgi:hypothetical protein